MSIRFQAVLLAFLTAALPLKAQTTGPWVDFTPQEWVQLEEAIDKGLGWLATQQNRNGSIGPNTKSVQPAHTALTTMAFLSRGHQPGQGEHGKMLERAIHFVLSTQDRYGFFVTDSNYDSSGSSYSHAIAGVMLAEVIGMANHSRNEQIAEAIERGLTATIKLQQRHAGEPRQKGGWRYIKRNSNDADLSVTTWHLLFLRAAKNANFNVPEYLVTDAANYVRNCFKPSDKGFGYFPGRNATITMTGAGTLCLFLAGQYDDPAAAEGIETIKDYNFTFLDKERWPYYTCYHCSQAASQAGGEVRQKTLKEITRYLLERQTEGGNWPKAKAGSVTTGPAYTTAMAILALTPSYQILPIYQQ